MWNKRFIDIIAYVYCSFFNNNFYVQLQELKAIVVQCLKVNDSRSCRITGMHLTSL